MIKLSLITILTLGFMGTVYAKKNCTDKPKQEWMKIDEFKKLVTKRGFTIRKFKQPGSCYEIYGRDKDGRKVEVYFNPVNGNIKKIEFED